MAITIDQQIDAIRKSAEMVAAQNRGKVSRQQMTQEEATTMALAFDAALTTLAWCKDNRDAVIEWKEAQKKK